MDRTQLLGDEKISKLLVKFSIPAIIGMLVNALYNVVDRAFIGNGVGDLGIAGITVSFPVMLVNMAFGMLIGFGATSLVSIRLGEQKKEEAEQIIGNGLVLLVSISIVTTVLGLILMNPMLKLLAASNDVLPYAKDYLSIILYGNIFMSIGFGMNNFIRAEGSPKIAMFTMLIGAVLNTVLDPIFIFVFGWGIRGAAYATILSQAVSSVWVMYHFLSGRSTLKLHTKNLKIKLPIAARIFSLGAAPFSMQLASSLVNAILNNSLRIHGGDIAISAMGVVMSISTLIIMPVFGINQGAQPIIGYNYGAKKYDRVKKALKLAIFAATVFVLVWFAIIMLFPGQLVSIFGKDNKELISFGSYALRTFLILLPIIGFQIVGANYFQAVGKPLHSALLSLSRQVLLLIPALLILPRFFGLEGVLFAGPAADIGSSIITATVLFLEIKHLDRKHQNSIENEPTPPYQSE